MNTHKWVRRRPPWFSPLAQAKMADMLVDRCAIQFDSISEVTPEALVGKREVYLRFDGTETRSQTSQVVSWLADMPYVNVWRGNITDDDLAHLSRVHRVVVTNCDAITNEGIAKLTGVRFLTVHGCKHVTSHCVVGLPNIKTLNISYDQIVDVTHLCALEHLLVLHCTHHMLPFSAIPYSTTVTCIRDRAATSNVRIMGRWTKGCSNLAASCIIRHAK